MKMLFGVVLAVGLFLAICLALALVIVYASGGPVPRHATQMRDMRQTLVIDSAAGRLCLQATSRA